MQPFLQSDCADGPAAGAQAPRSVDPDADRPRRARGVGVAALLAGERAEEVRDAGRRAGEPIAVVEEAARTAGAGGGEGLPAATDADLHVDELARARDRTAEQRAREGDRLAVADVTRADRQPHAGAHPQR